MKILITAHGHLASSMKNSVSMILGPLDDRVIAIDFETCDSAATLSARMEAQLDETMNIIFCDLKGGTPFNTAFLLAKKFPVKIICGMNLGMMLECLIPILQGVDVSVLQLAKEAGNKAIETFDLL